MPAQVYITVFADGPTRVLRFADVQNVGAEEAQQSILDLAARLKQVQPVPLLMCMLVSSTVQDDQC